MIISIWKNSLTNLLRDYEARRSRTNAFYPKLFLFFVGLNLSCYWAGLFTAFPEYLHGQQGLHYLKIQVPVGILGAVFDSLSFFVTIYIIRKALLSKSSLQYVGHLSLDGVIAVLATFWVLLIFIVSGWIVHALTPGAALFGEEAPMIVKPDTRAC